MKSLFSVAAVVGALALAAAAPAHAAQPVVNNPFIGPSYNTYSWGIEVSPAEGPQVSYTWAELNAKAAPAMKADAAHSAGADRQIEHGRALVERFAGPGAVNEYSWGIEVSPNEGPATSYTWDQLKNL